MKQLIRQNIYYYGTILLFIVLGGILLTTMHKADVTIWVNNQYSAVGDQFFLITNLGGTIGFSVLIIIAIWVLKGWRIALKATICFVATALVIQFLKYIVFPGELRPTLYFEGKHTLRLLEGVVQLKTESFPSGHTAAAFSIATFLALLFSGKQWHWLLLIAAASVGYARLYLSQHFITDVYTGMVLGVLITTLVYYFYPTQKLKDNDKPGQAIHS